jgi:hypothetical protein
MEFLGGRSNTYFARPDGHGRKSVFTALFERSCEHQSPKVPVRSLVRTPEQTFTTSCARVQTLTYPVWMKLGINADLIPFGSFYPNPSSTTRFFLRFFIQRP